MEITLRAWTLQDAPFLAEGLNNRKVQENLRDGLPFPYTADDARAYIQMIADAPQESIYAWAIIADGRPVGNVGLQRMENIHRYTGELGYYLAQPYWGKQVMSQAVKQACGIIFESTDILRIFAEPFSYNTASCRVLEKAGFALEGLLKNNAVKNGAVVDMKMYALLRSDFNAT